MDERSLLVNHIKILSYNFRRSDDGARVKNTGEIEILKDKLKLFQPHVLFIQGCNIAFLHLVIQEIKALNLGLAWHNVQDAFAIKKDTYESIITSLTLVKKGYTNFSKSQNDRGMLKFVVDVKATANDKTNQLSLITSELEPGTNIVCRRSQIESIGNITDQKVIFCGCTNILSWQQNIGTPTGWFDVWREVGTSTTEYTNGLERSDRIWYKGVECVKYDTILIDSDKGNFAMYAEFKIPK